MHGCLLWGARKSTGLPAFTSTRSIYYFGKRGTLQLTSDKRGMTLIQWAMLLSFSMLAQVSFPETTWTIRHLSVVQAEARYGFHILRPSQSAGLKFEDLSAVWAPDIYHRDSRTGIARARVGIRLTYRRTRTGGVVYIFEAKSRPREFPIANVGRIVASGYFGTSINALRERRDTGYFFDRKKNVGVLIVTSVDSKTKPEKLIRQLH